jgi:hypothetical protein
MLATLNQESEHMLLNWTGAGEFDTLIWPTLMF